MDDGSKFIRFVEGVVPVVLSLETQKILKSIKKHSDSDFSLSCSVFETPLYEVDLSVCIDWLNHQHDDILQASYHLRDSLVCALLLDIYQYKVPQNPSKKTPNWKQKTLWLAVFLTGTLFFACEGFDGMTAMLGLSILPAVPIFIVSLVFALISVGIFYFVEFVEISKSLNMQLLKVPKRFNTCLKEMRLLRKLRECIANELSAEDMVLQKVNLDLLKMIQQRFDALDKARWVLLRAVNSKMLKMAKFIIFSVQGFMFFGAGFYAGQTVALAIAALFIGSVSPTFWPIILVSVLVGVASLVVFWAIQRPALEAFVGRIFGLKREKIENYCVPERVLQEKNVTLNLECRITSILHRCQETNENPPPPMYSAPFFQDAQKKKCGLSLQDQQLLNEGDCNSSAFCQ